MDFHHHNSNISSPSSSHNPHETPPSTSWWESISKARVRIHALASILPSSSISSLADSDRPALSLLSSPSVYSTLSATLSGPNPDPLCHWLYDTLLSSDPHLRLIVLSFVPLLSHLYLSRISTHPPSSLAGFEAILLALYIAETKSRNGKPILVTIPDLSQSSIYHVPLKRPSTSAGAATVSSPSVGIVSPPLEALNGVKSTKRACVVGVAFHCYYEQISQMPNFSKLEFCRVAAGWAGRDCPCRREFDHENTEVSRVNGFGNGEIEEVVEDMGNMQIQKKKCDFDYDSEAAAAASKGDRIPLPWEILQPVLRILGHCLFGPLNSQEVKDAASFSVRCLYARASHDLVPQAILATRSLIQLDSRAREAAKLAAAAASTSSNANTPTRVKKPETLLVSR